MCCVVSVCCCCCIYIYLFCVSFVCFVCLFVLFPVSKKRAHTRETHKTNNTTQPKKQKKYTHTKHPITSYTKQENGLMWFCCFVVLFVVVSFVVLLFVCWLLVCVVVRKKSYSGDVWLVCLANCIENTQTCTSFSLTDRKKDYFIFSSIQISLSLLWSCEARPPPLRRFFIIYI